MSPQETDDIGIGNAGPDHPLFDESIEAIEHTILEEHRIGFHHVEASVLLEELRSVATRNSTGGRLLAACSRKFAIFVQTFAPYFSILSICTQVRGEWSGCFWGLVHLVFQTASNYMLFLEKIADMFEAIANVLPPYRQIYTICKQRIDSSQTDTEDAHLTMLMSFAYADIVRLCLDIYRIFLRDKTGMQLRHMAFTSPQWRPLDSRFAQLEGRLTHHRRWLEKETESYIQDFSFVDQYRQKYLRYLHRQADVNVNDSNGELEDERMVKRMRRVEIIRRWVSNSTQLQDVDITAGRTEHLGSCNWFLDSPKYRAWKGRSFNQIHANDKNLLNGDWHDRVLFVQARAGFGKSFIAKAVVDDLAAETEDVENSAAPSTAYFCVKASHMDPVHPDEMLRQLSIQLLYAHRHDPATLDTVCLLLRKTSFQDTASASDIFDLLALLLRQHPSFLVIDGLDECSDEKAFLSSIADLCRAADVRAIIFSRPAIKIPLEYQRWASDAPHIIPLDCQHNVKSIESFLSQSLSNMADQGYLNMPIGPTLVSHVAQRSDGVFLWASLFLKYLRLPTFLPDERLAIIQNVQMLQGLEALYNHIFEDFGRRQAYERRIVADVVRWLTFPVHRLCTSALRTALTVSIDMAMNEDSLHIDVLQALPELTCGLIETSGDSVSFAHPSVREYLQSSASLGSEFSLYDESSVHAHLTARCLSYLAHDVPKRPLGGLSPRMQPMIPVHPTSSGASYRTSKSGDSGYKSLSSSDSDNAFTHPHPPNSSTPNIRAIPFDTNLPFLRYASLCWPIHLSRALAPTHNNHHYIIPCPGPFEAVPFIPPLSAFLSSRIAVTAWVEASFRYSLPPTLTRLVGPLADLKAEISPATIEGKELRLVLDQLNILSERLMELKRGHATSLRENPSLIWQIGDTVGDDYWPVWDGSIGMPR